MNDFKDRALDKKVFNSSQTVWRAKGTLFHHPGVKTVQSVFTGSQLQRPVEGAQQYGGVLELGVCICILDQMQWKT